MAHHKSAVKRISTNARDNLKNRKYLSILKTEIKKVRAATGKEEAEALYRIVSSKLDKFADKGIIHKNKAANQKSRLAAIVNNLK
jgi:small subunit ribosomal protein S20